MYMPNKLYCFPKYSTQVVWWKRGDSLVLVEGKADQEHDEQMMSVPEYLEIGSSADVYNNTRLSLVHVHICTIMCEMGLVMCTCHSKEYWGLTLCCVVL